ncbi:MAG: M64 family metallopeptidase [Salinivirgaceae bacterium]
MKLLTKLIIVLLTFGTTSCSQGSNFDRYFMDKTLRFDYFHTGNAETEHFAPDQVVSDGIWAGSTTNLIDKLRLGKYFFEIQDLKSGKTVYSRGFASIYGEWETTPEAKKQWGAHHESIRFPWPKNDIKIVFYKRDENYEFAKIWEHELKTDHWRTNKAIPAKSKITKDVHISGDPKQKVDIVLLSEGYTQAEMPKFHEDAAAFAKALFATEPFASRKNDFNIRLVEVPSPESGLAHPHQDIFRRSALSVTYGIFDSERYALGFDNKKIRDAAANVPYDHTAIIMNDSIYGGGGIYNLYITAAADNAFDSYLYVHEFGHHFADLADEYYASSTAYEMGSSVQEPWELNVTTKTKREEIKWGDLIAESTPIPTPWDKEKFDKQSIETQKERNKLRAAKTPEHKMNNFFKAQQEREEEHLGNIEHAGKTGLYEGAQYHSHGVYRSAPNCIMFTRTDHFCPACQHAINKVIDQYAN